MKILKSQIPLKKMWCVSIGEQNRMRHPTTAKLTVLWSRRLRSGEDGGKRRAHGPQLSLMA
jgi:hypothetical protein